MANTNPFIEARVTELEKRQFSVPNPSTSTPLANNTNGSIGESLDYARADHVHPISDFEGVTLDDVNSAIGSALSSYLPLSGGDVSGIVTVPNPTDNSSDTQVVNKHYVDDKIEELADNVSADKVSKNGNETIGGNKTFSNPINGNLNGTASSASRADTADTLGSTTVGSSTVPIYLNNGVPTVCSISSSGETSSGLANPVNISIANHDGTDQSDPVSFNGINDVILKLPSDIKANIDGYVTEANVSHYTEYLVDDTSGNLVNNRTNKGSASKFVYFSNGVPVTSNSNIGNTNTPVYLNRGEFTACSKAIIDINDTMIRYGSTGSLWKFNNTSLFINKRYSLSASYKWDIPGYYLFQMEVGSDKFIGENHPHPMNFTAYVAAYAGIVGSGASIGTANFTKLSQFSGWVALFDTFSGNLANPEENGVVFGESIVGTTNSCLILPNSADGYPDFLASYRWLETKDVMLFFIPLVGSTVPSSKSGWTKVTYTNA